MLTNEKFIIASKNNLSADPNTVNPMDVIENLNKFVFKFEGECDGRFAKRLAKLIESEKKNNLQ